MAPDETAGSVARGRRTGHPGGLRVLLKLTWIELKLFLREPMTIVFTFAFPVVLMFVLGEVFGNQKGSSNEHVFGSVGAMNYYAPAYIAVVTMSVGVIMLPARLTDYRAGGVYSAASAPRWCRSGRSWGRRCWPPWCSGSSGRSSSPLSRRSSTRCTSPSHWRCWRRGS